MTHTRPAIAESQVRFPVNELVLNATPSSCCFHSIWVGTGDPCEANIGPPDSELVGGTGRRCVVDPPATCEGVKGDSLTWRMQPVTPKSTRLNSSHIPLS